MNVVIKPWHGIPRENIKWQPEVDEELCIGCGICVTECGRMVFRFDYEKKKPVVFAPLNCMVACVTCANTCTQHAISFPPLSSIHRLINEHKLIQKARQELNAAKEKYEVGR
ncbi:MAG: 4Fe-4S dicluster domain-containing protein [Thermoanaerobaculaceae bacterium]